MPVHNRIEYTKRCLKALRNQTYKEFQIIIIDDGSKDSTKKVLREEFQEVEILTGDGNLWWTAAINKGIRYALKNDVEYIITLNNDTIPEKKFVEKMIFWAEKKPKSLLGALTVNIHTKLPVYGGEIIDWKNAKAKFYLDSLTENQRKGIYKVTHFPGRGLLIPSYVFKKIGLFDEIHFPHYASDYDFTHKAVRFGFDIYCNYDSILYVYNETSGNQQYRRSKSLKNYINYLFTIKGGGNLIYFSLYTFRNAPWYYVMTFLLKGYIQRIVGYWLKK